MARSTMPRAGTGGLLLPTLPRIVTAWSTILAMVSSTIPTTAGTPGSSSGVLGHPKNFTGVVKSSDDSKSFL